MSYASQILKLKSASAISQKSIMQINDEICSHTEIKYISYIIFHAQAHTLITQVATAYQWIYVRKCGASGCVSSCDFTEAESRQCVWDRDAVSHSAHENKCATFTKVNHWLTEDSCIRGKARIIPLDQSIHKGVSVFKYLSICIFYALYYLFIYFLYVAPHMTLYKNIYRGHESRVHYPNPNPFFRCFLFQ